MIVWTGFGFLGFVIPVLMLFLGQAASPDYYDLHKWVAGALLILSAIPVGLIGYKLNYTPDKVLMDPATNQEVTLKTKNRHTAFFIPLQYFSAAIVALGISKIFELL